MTKLHYSHIAKPNGIDVEWRCQSTDEHNEGVAELSSVFASSFGFGDIGRIMGLLHDKGKEQVEWQKYLQGTIEYDNKKTRTQRTG